MQKRLARQERCEAVRKLKLASPLIGGKSGVLLRKYLNQLEYKSQIVVENKKGLI